MGETNELVSPKLDVVFKMLFTKNPDLLKDFVASILDVEVQDIAEFVIVNGELAPEDTDGKFSRLDINMVVDGRLVNIEIQIRKYPDYKDRALFYWAKLFTSDLKSGGVYGDLKQAITINVLDFTLFENREQYFTEVVPVIRATGDVFSDKMVIKFFELGKVNPTGKMSELELWLKFLRAESREDFEMIREAGNPAVTRAVDVIYQMSKDEKIRERARIREKALHDEASALAGAKREGLTKGRAEGLAEGLTKGRVGLLNQLLQAGLLTPEQASQF